MLLPTLQRESRGRRRCFRAGGPVAIRTGREGLGIGPLLKRNALLVRRSHTVPPSPPPLPLPPQAQEIKRGPFLVLQLALASPTMRTALKAGGIAASFVLLHYISMQAGGCWVVGLCAAVLHLCAGGTGERVGPGVG